MCFCNISRGGIGRRKQWEQSRRTKNLSLITATASGHNNGCRDDESFDNDSVKDHLAPERASGTEAGADVRLAAD